MQNVEVDKELSMPPLQRQAYRPMFLFGALFSAVAMLLWGLLLSNQIKLDVYANVLFWHQHEMIFGFVAAIIIGFLLTAVQNWTGVRATSGWQLLLLTSVWATGRLLILFGGSLPKPLVAAVDLAFLPIAAIFFMRILMKAGQYRNMFFVPVLFVLTLCNLLMHIGAINPKFYSWIQHGSLSSVWVVTLIMAVVSGRVMPMFTANGTGTPRVSPIVWLDKLGLATIWLILAIHLFNLVQYVPAYGLAALFGLSAIVNGIRFVRLRFWITWKVPLLWSFHFAAACIPIGLALFALRYAGFTQISESSAVHALTAGAMGVMILAMMARVSLGHSGRPLHPRPVVSVAFLMVIAAAIIRVVSGIFLPAASSYQGYYWAIAAWVIAYSIYIIVYFVILTTPRADGRPG